MRAIRIDEAAAGGREALSALAAAAAAGDAAATADLLEQVWPDAFRVAWSVLGERTAAEDAAQDACARVLTSLASLRDATSFRPWFFRIVVNEAKSRLRSGARAAPPEDGVAHEAVSREEHLDLTRALRALAPPLRAAVVLHYYVGLNSAQIGSIVGATSMTVRWRLVVARRQLRAALGNAPLAPLHQTRTGDYVDEPHAVR